MAGIVIFTSAVEALRMGYQIYDKTARGYVVRRRTPNGWALALVELPAQP